MKCALGISNFLEEISSLSHFIVFLYFFALTTAKSLFTWKDLNDGKYWGKEEKGATEDKRWLDGITDSMEMCLSNSGRLWRTRKSVVLQFMGLQSQTWLCDWRTRTILHLKLSENKDQTKPNVSRRKEENKSRNKWNRSEENNGKDQYN